MPALAAARSLLDVEVDSRWRVPSLHGDEASIAGCDAMPSVEVGYAC